MKNLLKLSALVVAASFTSSVFGIAILSPDRYLGASTGNGNDHLTELNALITSHNSATDSEHGVHTTIPSSVALATTHNLGDSDAGDVKTPLQFVLQTGDMWLGFKAGTNLGFYYLGGIAVGETVQFETTFKQGVSNWSTYSGPSTRVPDSGTSILLLSLGILGLAGLRRSSR